MKDSLTPVRLPRANSLRIPWAAPAQEETIGGWGGFVADIEAAGKLRATPPGVG